MNKNKNLTVIELKTSVGRYSCNLIKLKMYIVISNVKYVRQFCHNIKLGKSPNNLIINFFNCGLESTCLLM